MHVFNAPEQGATLTRYAALGARFVVGCLLVLAGDAADFSLPLNDAQIAALETVVEAYRECDSDAEADAVVDAMGEVIAALYLYKFEMSGERFKDALQCFTALSNWGLDGSFSAPNKATQFFAADAFIARCCVLFKADTEQGDLLE